MRNLLEELVAKEGAILIHRRAAAQVRIDGVLRDARVAEG